ncbi:MAG: prolyl oligopeptidase family serine peptidase [Acidobacteriota bacterium]
MRRTLVRALMMILAASAPFAARAAESERPPATRRDVVRDAYGAVTVEDPYRWLEDQNAPETRAWIDAQNRYSESVLQALPGRDRLRRRLSELLRVDTTAAPRERAGRLFFFRRRADQDLSVLYVRMTRQGPDRVLIDPHALSADHRTSINLLDVSNDGRLVAYGIQQGGEDEVTIRFRDVDTGVDLPDALPRARYSGVSIAPGRKSLYYGRHEKEGPRVYVHTLGSPVGEDRKIFGDGYGPEKFIGIGLSDSGRWLVAAVSHGSAAVKTEIYVQDLAHQGSMVPIVNDLDARFNPELVGDRLLLETNWDAPKGRILSVDLADPARDKWKEIVPSGQSAIAGYYPVGGRIVVRYLENVLPKLRIFEADGTPKGEISLPGIGTVSALQGRWGSLKAFFTFVSFTTPSTVYEWDVTTGARRVWAKETVPVDSSAFEVRQVRYPSKDGTMIPMFLVHRKGMKLDGSHPALLTGYGGFNLPQLPAFTARVVAWVEHGGVYALANLRGGNEFGEEWHHAGMLGRKQNVFDDFIAAAEWLVRERYTEPARLAISGASNGGLLVGAAMTQRPDLFAAVDCSYPLLDMLRYQKFLVAGFWVPEYGSADEPEQFRSLYAYSPYHRVRSGTKYPAVLFITGDSDTRVSPLHARKMTALLQAATASDRPVILHYDTKAGHSRNSTPIPKQIDDLTDELSFLFAETSERRLRFASAPAA